jgi:hypothetical protein
MERVTHRRAGHRAQAVCAQYPCCLLIDLGYRRLIMAWVFLRYDGHHAQQVAQRLCDARDCMSHNEGSTRAFCI